MITHVTNSFTTPSSCWNFWVLGFASYIRKAKIFSEALLHFSRKLQRVLFIQNPSSRQCFKLNTKWKSMPWAWSGQGQTSPASSSHLSATLNRCLHFPYSPVSSHHVPTPQPVSFSLGLQNFFMQYKRLYLVLMWKLLKTQHCQTFFSISLLSIIQMPNFNQEIIMLFICTTSVAVPFLCCIFYRRMPTITFVYKQWTLWDLRRSSVM